MQDLTKGSLARNLIQLVRTSAIVLPPLALSRMSGFALHWIWYLAVGCV